LLDIPLQMMTLAGLMLRIAAIYDRPHSDVHRREVIIAILGGLTGRYAAQQLAKLVPVVGWGVSGLLGWTTTWGLGRAAIAYFEAEGDALLNRRVGQARDRVNQTAQTIFQHIPRPPRWPHSPTWLNPRRWLQRPRWLKLQKPIPPPEETIEPGLSPDPEEEQAT
jgi:uncharacterized protein (DUF697 family)